MSETRHTPGKGRSRDLPFPGTIVGATRRRCRLTALERAAATWCDRKGIGDRPAPLVPPEPAIVAAWLARLRVKLVAGSLELYQIDAGSVTAGNRRKEWRAEFDLVRPHEVYLNATEVAHILGFGELRGHISVRRLIEAGFLSGFAADPRAEYVYGHRAASWGKSTRGRRWRVHPDDLSRLLLEHPEQYDRAKVRGNPWRALAAEGHRKRKWLRVPEVAARLGCSASNVRDMLRLGDLQGVLMRDRQAISYYVRPAWLLDLATAGQPDFLRTIHGRKGLPPERAAHRARILAERERLQALHDADAKRLLCEVRDIAGRRRKAREAAALERELYPDSPALFPEPERIEARWRSAATFLRKYPDDGWGDEPAPMAAD
jgi:hypothetical protein